MIALILRSRIARYIGGVLVAIAVALGLRRSIIKGEQQREELRELKANAKAERERVNLDAELDQETDLLARARRSGVTKPKT